MKGFKYWFISCLGILFLFAPLESISQNALSEKRKSPLEMASYKYKDTYIKITYGKPYKRGREVFGDLVPYDKVWRTGANEATEITSTRDLMFFGKLLKSGTYSIFSIPNEKQWTIILNKEVGQFGAFEYDRTKDVLRVQVDALNNVETREDFMINFSPSEHPQEVILYLWWDHTRIEIPIGIIN